MFSSEFREREKAELAALDEVELLLAEAGGQP
jgi:hypothetical protein